MYITHVEEIVVFCLHVEFSQSHWMCIQIHDDPCPFHPKSLLVLILDVLKLAAVFGPETADYQAIAAFTSTFERRYLVAFVP